METSFRTGVARLGLRCTDPTYKEWKPANEPVTMSMAKRTDPTYKEWKHGNANTDSIRKLARTDPTYKEWKLYNMLTGIERPEQARILPTRNGNTTP